MKQKGTASYAIFFFRMEYYFNIEEGKLISGISCFLIPHTQIDFI